MKVKITLENNACNQEKGRLIRDANRELGYPLHISFSEDLTRIVMEGEHIYLPDREMLSPDLSVEGQLKEKGKGYEIFPKDKGKTVNLHLDSELVAELEQIKQHFHHKTQHDVLLELFKKGIDQYKTENK
ncbi:hypothetical protein ACTID9_14600 [Brevibacillus fluminis]|uniref:hypothetical protein n=1 Tax=Brevibacillus fluminis TaxID=511487 RepID=UPI003F8B9697